MYAPHLRSSEDERTSWYVVHTRSRHEAKVQSGLQARGLEVFLPRITVRSRRRDRFQLLEVPLFSGYLFVHTDLSSWAIQRYHSASRGGAYPGQQGSLHPGGS